MAAFVFTSLGQQLDSDGEPLSGGTVTVYQDGTTTLISLFSDEGLSVAATNPITLDASGRHDMRYFTAESYKVVVKNSASVTIYTRDDIDPSVPLGTGVLAVANGGTGASTAATARTNLGVPSNAELAAVVADVAALGGDISPPGGRLTLVTATPVMVSDATAITTVYYTPYLHNSARVFDGTDWSVVEFSETSQTLADATKSPAATTADNNYDMFLWSDSGTIRVTRGPAWTSATARGTGGGTTELVRQDGVWVNTNAITNGPAARRGVYVGTIRTNGSNQVDYMVAPAAAAGGSDNRIYIWNMYNRTDIAAIMRDSTDTWTYQTSVFRAANTSTANRITLINGQNEDAAYAEYRISVLASSLVLAAVAIGVDSITTATGPPISEAANSSGTGTALQANYFGYLGLGQHYITPLEMAGSTGTVTWRGDNGTPLVQQMSLQMRWKA